MNPDVVVPIDIIEPEQLELVEVGKLHTENKLSLIDVVHGFGNGVVYRRSCGRSGQRASFK